MRATASLMIALLLAGADVVYADARGVYVAPNGDTGGKGTTDYPWDIASALDGRRDILPGTTIYLKGGVYRFPDRSRNTQGYQVRLKGTEQAPIHVRPVSGERVTIDGYMQVLSPTEHL